RRHTRFSRDWSSDVCSSDLGEPGHVARWVACGRCGERPYPQGFLEPADWNVGDRYTGEWSTVHPTRTDIVKRLQERGGPAPERFYTLPGQWPKHPTWTLGGQIVLGSNIPGASIEVKVGDCGSEHVL